MEPSKERISGSRSSLVASAYNVRRRSIQRVEELAALIDSQGLLQNLGVTKTTVGHGKARKTRFAVLAGERRRRAMLLLHQRGRIADHHEVVCELVPPGAASKSASPRTADAKTSRDCRRMR